MLSVAMVGVFAWPAAGHVQLVSSSPADQTTVAKAPKKIELVFSGRVIENTAAMTATGPSGDQTLAARGSGNMVTASWLTDSRPGKYTVTYRVASADGHVMTGSLSFTISPTDPGDAPSGNVSEPEPTVSSDQAVPPTSGTDNAPGSVPPWLWAVVIAAVCGALIWWIVSRRRERTDD